MTQRYTVIKSKVPGAGGRFVEAFLLGLADLGSLGDRYFDLAGYPYETETEALSSDWLRLEGDFRAAVNKIDDLARAQAQCVNEREFDEEATLKE